MFFASVFQLSEILTNSDQVYFHSKPLDEICAERLRNAKLSYSRLQKITPVAFEDHQQNSIERSM